MNATVSRSSTDRQGEREKRRSWRSLALVPIAFVAAFLVGEGIPAWLGYDVNAAGAPVWVALLAFAGAVLVLSAPLPLTYIRCRRAAEAHAQGPWGPLIVGLSLVGGFALVNVASGLLVVAFG